jgi:flagellin-like protein
MHGVSEVIAIILILMITISLAGLAYMFMSTTMSDVTSSAGSTVDTTTSSMMTSFTIESIDFPKVYLRNSGQNPLSGISVYVNGVQAHFNVSPASIAAGQLGTITIFDFMGVNDVIKVTSSSGFSVSKTVSRDPCEKAVACWKFDEGERDYCLRFVWK